MLTFLTFGNYIKKIFLFWAIFAFVFMLILSAESVKAQTNENILSSSFLNNIDLVNNLKSGEIDEISFKEPSAMLSYYRSRKYTTFWTGNMQKLQQAKEALIILEDSWTHGLNPDNYHVKQIEKLIESNNSTANIKLELLLSDALIRYGQDLTGMRIPAASIGQKAEYWKQKLSGIEILNIIRSHNDVRKALATFPPQTALYNNLRNELISLTETFYKQGGDTDIDKISFDGILRPGYSHKSVAKIRKRLGVASPNNREIYIYDDKLALKVMDIQKKNDLRIDGVIGQETLKILNRSIKDKIVQITANMERLRWLERKRPEKYIVVNIPSMTLWAVKKGKVELEMPVVVGQKARKTQSFVAEITGVRVNPTWTVPFSIKKADFLPKLREDSSYLSDKEVEIYKGYGKNRITIDPLSIDWDNISMKELNKLIMVQTPGDHNALGRIRILMPNIYNIYLHDTNHKEVFSRNDRFQSSGCIRLSNPDAVANFIMNENEDWSFRKLASIKDSLKSTDINAKNKIPIYILYQSIWINTEGELIYGRDVYNNDKKLYEALALRNEVVVPKIKITDTKISYSTY